MYQKPFPYITVIFVAVFLVYTLTLTTGNKGRPFMWR